MSEKIGCGTVLILVVLGVIALGVLGMDGGALK